MLVDKHYCLITMAPSPITHSLRLSKTNLSLSLFSLFFHWWYFSLFSQTAPLPTCPQAAVITLSSPMRSCQSPCYFPPLLPATLACPPSSCLLSFARVSTLLTARCFFLFFLFLSIVKDLDTEKYVHLVSTLQKLLQWIKKINHGNVFHTIPFRGIGRTGYAQHTVL